MTRKTGVAAVLLLSALWSASVLSQNVLRSPDSLLGLRSRWKWASEEAARRSFSDGYWIGYAIKKSMAEHSYIGTYNSNRVKNSPTLGEVIGMPVSCSENIPVSGNERGTYEGTFSFNDKKRDPEVVKEIGILFHFTGRRTEEINETVVSNLSLHVDLDRNPLLWLGTSNDGESIDLLAALYGSSPVLEVRKKIIMAAGIHPPSEKMFLFLKSILLGSDAGSVREEAAFWLGESKAPGAPGLLEETAKQDRSNGVREKAIFAISLMDDSAATECLIHLATGEGEREMRTNAMFWLGQKATRKAVTSLRDIAIGNDDLSVEKSALFALSQLPENAGVEPLIHIAQHHTSAEIRKQAIFWLSQCEDPRAIDAIVEIVRR